MIRFETASFRPVSYLEAHGAAMLEAMGCTGLVPGALRGADVAAALGRLEEAAAQARATQETEAVEEDEDEEKARTVRFATRALPLIELLRAAVADEAYVTWENT